MSTFKNNGFNEVSESDDSRNRDTLVGIAVIIMVFISIYYLILNVVFKISGTHNIYIKMGIITALISLLGTSIPVILALAVKNTMWKTLLICLSVIYFFIQMYFSFQGVLSDLLNNFFSI